MSTARAKWEWVDNDGKTWKSYTPQHILEIDRAYFGNKPDTTIRINSSLVFRITFANMRQTNVKSGNYRSIRTAHTSRTTASNGRATWEWFDLVSKTWKPYSARHLAQMNQAYFADTKSVIIDISSSLSFKCDFEKLTQTNTRNGNSRAIRTTHSRGASTPSTPTAAFSSSLSTSSTNATSTTTTMTTPVASTFCAAWEWLDNDNTTWRPYAAAQAARLDKAWFSHKDDVEIVVSSSLRFRCDLNKMIQANAANGNSRRIRTSHKPRAKRSTTPPPPKPAANMGGPPPGTAAPALAPKTSVPRTYIPKTVSTAFNKGNMGRQMLQTILSNAGPPHWQKMGDMKVNCRAFELRPYSKEYKEVERHFKSSVNLSVVKISRIQNRYLWHAYTCQKMQLISKNQGLVNERMVFHGTGTCPPNLIYEGKNSSGFDPRLGRGFYGVGAYFAEKARYPVYGRYAHKCSNGNSCLFLARVMTGVSKIYGNATDEKLKRQPQLPAGHTFGPGLYDSVTGGPHRPTMGGPGTNDSVMYIVYDSSMAYPEYLIEYRRS